MGDDSNFSGTIINRLTQVDTSCNDLSGVVTTNIGNIASNASLISSNTSSISGNTSSFDIRKTIVDSSFNDLSNNISELDISYFDLSGVVTANIGNISTNASSILTNTSNIKSNTNNKAPKADPSFTGKVYICTSNNEAHLNIQNSELNKYSQFLLNSGYESDWKNRKVEKF